MNAACNAVTQRVTYDVTNAVRNGVPNPTRTRPEPEVLFLRSFPYEDSLVPQLHNKAAYLASSARLEDRLTHSSLPRTAQLKLAT